MINVRRIKTASHLVRIAFRKYRWAFVVMMVLGFLAGFSGSIGISVIIPIFFIISGKETGDSDAISGMVRHAFAFLHLPLDIPFLLVLMVSLFIAKAGINFAAQYVNERLSASHEEELRGDLFAKTMQARWAYLLERKVGYLERLLLQDTIQSASIISQLSDTILTITSFATYAFVAINISAPITFATIAFGGLMFFVFKPIFSKTRSLSAKTGVMYKISGHHIAEHTIGAKIVKAAGAEPAVISNGRSHFSSLHKMKIKASYYGLMISSFIEPLGLVFIAMVFLFSYRTPGFNLASFAVVVYLIQKMFSFIQTFQGRLHNLNNSIPYLQAVVSYRQEAMQQKEIDTGTKEFLFQKSLTFENVSFAYDGGKQTLSDISFTITRGDMIGIIGPSGAGKTTMVDLLLRLFDPSSGTIRLDNVPISEIRLASWREHIGYVPQDTFLLNGSIEDNIRFYNEAVTHGDIEAAVARANLSDVIENLPDGLATNVGERGIKLSGGQRQRIALARALARNPDILILDEATSNLDMASEAIIQKAIFGLKHTITIIIIAHRISTIEHADRKIAVNNGHVEAS